MAARAILEAHAEKTGWNVESMFDLLCDYVDNQQSDDALEDFVAEHAADECDETAAGHMVKCARCDKGVRDDASYGLGDVGDNTYPSFCSSACYDLGPMAPLVCADCGKATKPLDGGPVVCPCGALLTTDRDSRPLEAT